jgi:hypothetical protein
VSGAPIPNKTGHSGRSGLAAHHKVFEHGPAVMDAGLPVIDFDLVDEGVDIGPPERDGAVADVFAYDTGESGDLSSVILILGLSSADARSNEACAMSLAVFRTEMRSCSVGSAGSATPFLMAS